MTSTATKYSVRFLCKGQTKEEKNKRLSFEVKAMIPYAVYQIAEKKKRTCAKQ